MTVLTAMSAVLKTNASTLVQERGAMFLINNNTLTISFNPVAGIATQLVNDTITYVIYNNLSSIRLQPMNHPELATSLGTVINMSTIQCYM
jgi:hypothetical protein